MITNKLKTKIAAACLAGTLAVGFQGAASPVAAEAFSIGSVIGAAIGGAITQ